MKNVDEFKVYPVKKMYYVYLLRSINNSQKTYIGYTTNLKERVKKHNEGGFVATATHRPWKVEVHLAFANQEKAIYFIDYFFMGNT